MNNTNRDRKTGSGVTLKGTKLELVDTETSGSWDGTELAARTAREKPMDGLTFRRSEDYKTVIQNG